MTYEEKIERLKGFRDYLCAGNPIWNIDECREVFDSAIEAMEMVNGIVDKLITVSN